MLVMMWNNWNPAALLERMENSTSTLEISLTVSLKK